jgi:hypothetical protein
MVATVIIAPTTPATEARRLLAIIFFQCCMRDRFKVYQELFPK